MEVKACMGCFVEWDRERDECPVCGWSPQKPLESLFPRPVLLKYFHQHHQQNVYQHL